MRPGRRPGAKQLHQRHGEEAAGARTDEVSAVEAAHPGAVLAEDLREHDAPGEVERHDGQRAPDEVEHRVGPDELDGEDLAGAGRRRVGDDHEGQRHEERERGQPGPHGLVEGGSSPAQGHEGARRAEPEQRQRDGQEDEMVEELVPDQARERDLDDEQRAGERGDRQLVTLARHGADDTGFRAPGQPASRRPAARMLRLLPIDRLRERVYLPSG